MDAKILVALLIVINCYSSCGAALRRTPKVYNALITTDENLTSSRAYPVIQPTIHETGIASYPFGPFNPYGFYGNSLLRFGQPLVPGLPTRDQNLQPQTYQPFQPQHPQQYQPQPYQPQLPPSGPPSDPPSGPQSGPALEPQSQNEIVPPPSAPEQEPIPYPMQDPKQPQMQPGEKLPIQLNEYGLPPSLIPLQPYPQRNRQPLPVNLPPYPYQNFPVLYEPYNGFREHYLPPYDYLPSHTYGVAPAPQKPQPNPFLPINQMPSRPIEVPKEQQPEPSTPAPSTPAPIVEQLTTEVPLESIKNTSASKNAEVPDVPPPPIPSGGKSTQSA